MNINQNYDNYLDNYPIGIKDSRYVPQLEFNAQKLVEYLKKTGKPFEELTKEEIEKLK